MQGVNPCRCQLTRSQFGKIVTRVLMRIKENEFNEICDLFKNYLMRNCSPIVLEYEDMIKGVVLGFASELYDWNNKNITEKNEDKKS
jgi:hypothetical protein